MTIKKCLAIVVTMSVSAASVAGDEPVAPGYVADPDWMTLPEGQQTIGDMHGDIAVAKDGRVFVSVEDGPHYGVQIYSPDGHYLGNLDGAPYDLHGFILHTAKDGQEYLYGASLNGQRIIKISLNGKIVLDIDAHSVIPAEHHGPLRSGGNGLKLTGTAVSADDHIYVVDGYGRDIIHHLDENGAYVRSFGGKDDPWYFNTCHKIIFDTRSTPELLTCADRENGRLLRFDVELDTPVREIYSVNFRRPAALAVKGELMAVAEILGRVSLIDRDGKTVATLGTNTNRHQIATPIHGPDVWQPGVLQSPHGVAFDNDGNVLVAEWNEFGRVVLFRTQPAEQNAYDQRREQSLRPQDVDVEHYRIALTLNEDTQSFAGQTAVTFSSLVDGLDSLALDAVNFEVERIVDAQGKRLEFTQDEGVLTVSLGRTLERSETATITVDYSATNIGTDKNVGLDFRPKTKTNPRLVNSLNWPNGARYWFPSFDHPSDWASHETIITTTIANRVVANGSLVSDTVDSDSGLRTVHWHQTKQQPTYLYSFAAGPYSVLDDNHGDLPLHYWVYPGDEAVGVDAFTRTPEIIAYYEDLYGMEFPWEKYDQIIVPGIGGGAESTSATLLGRRVIQLERDGDKGASDWLLAHEIAHQWWGDVIGYRDWTHAWMAESFASHGEYLFLLDDDADEGALYILDYKDSYLKEAREKFIRPIVTNKWDIPNDMFDRHGYEKGAVVLNMFRDLVGTDTYDEILNRFLATHAYSNVTTDDFFETVSDVTSEDYSWFFEQWVLSPGHPVLDVSYEWNAQTKKLALTIKQTQDTSAGVPVFRLPIKIGITTSEGKNVESVWLTEQSQSFEFDVAQQPLMVRFDEGDILLKEWSLHKPESELRYQMEHDNVIGRQWATDQLQGYADD